MKSTILRTARPVLSSASTTTTTASSTATASSSRVFSSSVPSPGPAFDYPGLSRSSNPSEESQIPVPTDNPEVITDEAEWKRSLRSLRRWRMEVEEMKKQKASTSPPSRTSSTFSSSSDAFSHLSSNILSALVASGASLGHSPSSLSPPFTPYVYGTRSSLHIIDLEQTVPLLRKAANLTRAVTSSDGIVLFVGTRPEHRQMCLKAAERCGGNGYAVAGNKWMAGTLTNSMSVFGNRPIKSRSHLPDLVVILNPSENLGLIRECTKVNVPTVGIVDSNTDPRLVTYAIPANMESMRTADLIVSLLSMAGQQGNEKRLQEQSRRNHRASAMTPGGRGGLRR